jgi:hypothetical protein
LIKGRLEALSTTYLIVGLIIEIEQE